MTCFKNGPSLVATPTGVVVPGQCGVPILLKTTKRAVATLVRLLVSERSGLKHD